MIRKRAASCSDFGETSKKFKSADNYCDDDSDNIRNHAQAKNVQVSQETKWIISQLERQCDAPVNVIRNIIEMIEDNCTIPFIVRYRGDKTGNMDADNVLAIKQAYLDMLDLQAKKQSLLNKIEKTGDNSRDVRKSVLSIDNFEDLKHISAQYKTEGKRTKVGKAKALGLENVAVEIMEQNNCEINFSKYVDRNKNGLKNDDDVRQGVKDIMADIISKNSKVLDNLQTLIKNTCITVHSTRIVEKKSKTVKDTLKKFEQYYAFTCSINNLKPYQVLALNRGEREKIIRLKFDIPNNLYQRLRDFCLSNWSINNSKNGLRELLFKECFKDSYDRLIEPFIIRKIRSQLNEKAQQAGIKSFALNLRTLLLSNPVRGYAILGIDPGYSHGCKMALISASGNVLWTYVLNQCQRENYEQLRQVKEALVAHNCELISLGNGSGCRQMENYLSRYIKEGFFKPLNVQYTITNESGSSHYSCSSVAKEEFPDLDAKLISAVFIARCVQDPLNEFLKVEPGKLGIGMYQHDMPEKKLLQASDEVFSESVSFVGVDVNVASINSLNRVSGLNKTIAKNIVEWRNKYGSFSNREQLKCVKGIGPKIFQQASGFLRILAETATSIGDNLTERKALLKSKHLVNDINPLDRTWIHPELYSSAHKFLDICGVEIDDLGKSAFVEKINEEVSKKGLSVITDELDLQMERVALIKEAFTKPVDYDYRSQFSKPIFRSGCTSMCDIKSGMILKGFVSNVTDFGAFVDIGVGTNGLIHKSHMRHTVLKNSDRVNVKVLNVEPEQKRIQLSLISVENV